MGQEMMGTGTEPIMAAFERQFQWSWNWPVWVSVLAAGAAVLWVTGLYAREVSHFGRGGRGLLVVLRLATVALLCFLLAEPTIERNLTGKPRLGLLVDRSASMRTVDQDRQTRIDQWSQLLTSGEPSILDQLQTLFQVDVVPFDAQVTLLEPTNNESLSNTLRGLANSSPETGSGNASATRLGDAIDFALRELPGPPPTALVVFSDGILTRGQPLEKAANQARARGVPIYTVAIGSQHRQPDVALSDIVAEEVVFPGDVMSVEATIRSTGFSRQVASLILRDTATGRQLAQQTVKLPADGTERSSAHHNLDNNLDKDLAESTDHNVHLLIRPTEPGQLDLELQVVPLPGESNIQNNTARCTVQVRDQPIRVLLVQSSPSYEYRAIKSMLQRDPAIRLHVRLQESDRQFAEIDPTAVRSFPLSEERLQEYDVVLLGDVDPGLLPRTVWPMLLRFVSEHGGGLGLIAGPRFMPRAFEGYRSFSVLMPIAMRPETDNGLNVAPRRTNPLRTEDALVGSFPIRPTAFGRRDPSMQLANTIEASDAVWQSLPPVTWLLNAQKVKLGARVLAEYVEPIANRVAPSAGAGLAAANARSKGAQSRPVILRHYVGAGEVLMHLTDETWRWRWRTDDRYFARYWGQAVRRLAKGRLTAGRDTLALTTDRREYQPSDVVRVRAEFHDVRRAPAEDQFVLNIEGSIQPLKKITLQRRLGFRGRFETMLRNLPPGQYELTRPQESASCSFRVVAPPLELARIAVDERALAEAARLTHGKAYTVSTAAQILKDLPPARPVMFERLPPYRIASSHYVIGLFCTLLAIEWLLRRRGGML